MDKNIPLSALIRIGAKASGQCRGTLTNSKDETCAIGAAYLGQYGEFSSLRMLSTIDALSACGFDPWRLVRDPDQHDLVELVSTIVHMNDTRRLTREQIADWLETQGL